MDKIEKLRKRSARISTAFDVLFITMIVICCLVGGFFIGVQLMERQDKATHAYLEDTNGDGIKDIVIVHSGGGKTVLLGSKDGKKYLRLDDVTNKALERFK